MATLSKSKYTLSCQCQKALWLRTHKPEVATIDASVEARFAAGNEIGDIAKSLFGEYVDTTTYTDGSKKTSTSDHKNHEEVTRTLLYDDYDVLYHVTVYKKTHECQFCGELEYTYDNKYKDECPQVCPQSFW